MVVCPKCHELYPSDVSVCPDDGQILVPEELLGGGAKDEALPAGTMVGEYRIDRKLGAGSFGAVYAGTQPIIDKRVAIKVLHRKFAEESGVVSRFVAEARLVNRIRHRNIVDVFSFGLLEDKQPYFVMDLLDGLTLAELIRRERRVAVVEALPILTGIAAGLDAAHEAGIAHRDLKPDNVFLAVEKGGSYFPKLLDFGVAKLVSDDMAHKTATGAVIGTPSYMAPEQCRGKSVDHRADVYALGVVIHEMLTGHRPFQADSVMDVLLMHVSEPPPPMSEQCADLPPALDAPVLAMLAKKPDQRPRSAGAAVAALAERARASGADRTVQIRAPRAVANASAREAESSLGEASVALEPAEHAPASAPTVTIARGVAAAKTPSKEVTALPSMTGLTESKAAPQLSAPAMTADGRFALSTKGNTIKVWDLRTGKAVHTFPGQGGLSLEAPTGSPREEGDKPGPSSPRAGARAPSTKSERPARSRTALAALAVVAGVVILAALAHLRESRTPPVPVTAETAKAPDAAPR